MYEMAYKYRCYPMEDQRQFLAKTFGCARYVWNWALEHRTNAYHEEGESLGFAAMCKRLTKLKQDEDHKWLKEPSSVVLQQSLRNQERAFDAFFDGRNGYPSFKRKHDHQSARHTKAAFSYDAETQTLSLAKMLGDSLDVRWSRDVRGEPTSVTITKDPAGRYFVSISFKAPVQDLPKTGKTVGVDVGVESYHTLSCGEKVGNPRFLEGEYRRLRRAQQRLSRKEKGSANWKKQKRHIAKLHARIADKRSDFLHKLTTRLVTDYDVICVETLSVKNMQKNRSLAKAISDASWSEFVRQLEYKAEWYGKTVVKIDRFFPSTKRCSACGHVGESKPLDVREWKCEECGVVHDRDVNAAINIRDIRRCAIAGTAGLAGAQKSYSRAGGDPLRDGSGGQRKTKQAFEFAGQRPTNEQSD